MWYLCCDAKSVNISSAVHCRGDKFKMLLYLFLTLVLVIRKYSGGDKTSVESLGGDFSIINAFNPRNLGAK